MPEALSAPAKINLSLLIQGVRDDGYHDIESLFVPVPGLCDTLTIAPGEPGAGCAVTPELPGCPPEKNLVFRAWQAYGRATGFAPDIRVRLEKRIPSGAGLGGGSSNAACLLRWLNARAGSAALDAPALNALAAKLGADVPFFLLDGPALAEGIGERLEQAALDLSAFTLVLALPREQVATPWAYQAWDAHALSKKTGQGLPACLTTGDVTNKRRVSLSPVVARNDFEVVVFPARPRLRAVKELLLRLGAAAAVMSGSGAGIASLFRDVRLADKAADALAAQDVPVHVEPLRHWGVAKR